MDYYREWYNNVHLEKLKVAVDEYIKPMVFAKSVSIEYKYFDNPDFYDDYILSVNDISTKIIEAYQNKVKFLSFLAASFLISIFIAFLSIPLIIIAFLGSVAFALLSIAASKRSFKLKMDKTKTERYMDYISRQYSDKKSVRDIKITGLNKLLMELYKLKIKELKFINDRDLTKIFFTRHVGAIINTAVLMFVILVITVSIYNGNISLTNFFSLMNAFINLNTTLTILFSVFPEMKEQSLYFKKFFTFMNSTNVSTGTLPRMSENPDIEIKDLWFRYTNSDDYVLKGLTLDIPFGRKVAIVGLNGSGKSTIVKLLLRLYEPSCGSIKLGGINISDYENALYINNISICFQDPTLYPFSIKYNVVMNLDDEINAELMKKSMEISNISEFISDLEHGTDTTVTRMFDENGIELSGGMAQKLAITRALYKKSKVVILDEPTNFLDIESETKFNDLLFHTISNKTVVIISHRLASIKNADIIYLISDGKVVQMGKHKDLIQENGFYKTLYADSEEDET